MEWATDQQMPEYRFPSQPPKDALEWFRAKGFKPAFDHRDVWRQEHAQAFTVAKAMRMDVLTSIRESLDQALAEGKTLAQFRQELTPTLQKLGWWGRSDEVDPLTGEVINAQLGSPRRLKTIYRTNMRTARAAGQWQRIQRRSKTHPYLVYELGPSEQHRVQHVNWAGIILRADDPFWSTHYPPNGWGCKCRVRQINQREHDKLMNSGEFTDKAPQIRNREYINDRTGETLQVPNGIDPGWDYNPGMARGKAAKQHVAQTKKTMTKALAKPVQTQGVQVFPADLTFSTCKNVTQEGVQQVLSQIPGAAPQVEKLARFMEAHPTKTLFLKLSDQGKGKKAWELEKPIGEFLGLEGREARSSYYSPRAGRSNGWTRLNAEYVVVKAKASDKLTKIDPDLMAAAVDAARHAQELGDRSRFWSMRATYDALNGESHPGLVNTWIHEVGHQVHAWAGLPRAPMLKSLTLYSDTNSLEWHAEHFTAWLMNRASLAKWDESVAIYFDELIEVAIQSDRKTTR
jgi:hypothetical protein